MKRPLCTSCNRHYQIIDTGAVWCDLPVRVSLATGKEIHDLAEDQRRTDGMCKPQAIRFVPIDGEPAVYVEDGKPEVESEL